MYEDEATNLRVEALDRAVRVNLASGGNETNAETVKRAEAFYKFLSA